MNSPLQLHKVHLRGLSAARPCAAPHAPARPQPGVTSRTTAPTHPRTHAPTHSRTPALPHSRTSSLRTFVLSHSRTIFPLMPTFRFTTAGESHGPALAA